MAESICYAESLPRAFLVTFSSGAQSPMGASLSRPALLVTVLSVAACGDAGPVAPDAAAPSSVSVSQVVVHAATPGALEQTPDALLHDAVTRIMPALGTRGEALTGVFARLQSANGAARLTALRELANSLDRLEQHAPSALQADLDALRLNVEAMRAATDHPTR